MSRVTLYHDNRMSVVAGKDHVLGEFIQLYDKEMRDETPEGEGLMYEWSEALGVETNYTELPSTLSPILLIDQYINLAYLHNLDNSKN